MTLVEQFLVEKRGVLGRIENKIVDFANRTGMQQKVANFAHSVGYDRANHEMMNGIEGIVGAGTRLAVGQIMSHATGHPTAALGALPFGLGRKALAVTPKIVNMARGVHKQLQLQHNRNKYFDRAAHSARFARAMYKRGYDSTGWDRTADEYEAQSKHYHNELLRHRGEI